VQGSPRMLCYLDLNQWREPARPLFVTRSIRRSPRWHPPFAISLALGPGIQLLGSTTEPPMQDGRGWEQSGRDLSTVRCLAGLTIDPGEVGGHETSRSRNRFMTDIDSILAERKVFLTRSGPGDGAEGVYLSTRRHEQEGVRKRPADLRSSAPVVERRLDRANRNANNSFVTPLTTHGRQNLARRAKKTSGSALAGCGLVTTKFQLFASRLDQSLPPAGTSNLKV